MKNIGHARKWKKTMKVKNIFLKKCFRANHGKFMENFHETKSLEWFEKQWPGIQQAIVGRNYPVLEVHNPFYISPTSQELFYRHNNIHNTNLIL